MGRVFDRLYFGGVKISWVRVRYAMDRGFEIPWFWGQNTMSRGSIYHG